MTNNPKGQVRAYFSHSYRREDKHRNLFFWKLFNEEGCYFTVDRKPDKPLPMYVSYLEWLMRRSDCFIAVIPKRLEKSSPYNFSRYQLFEMGLAYQARKPRLVFVEDNLQAHFFRGAGDEICFFHPIRYEDERDRFKEKAARLMQKVKINPVDPYEGRKPVAILLERREPYTEELVQVFEETIRASRHTFGKVIRPFYDFENAFLFSLDVQDYEVIITEVRPPYIAIDLLGSIQQQCIPTIRICHLREDETAEQVSRELNLAFIGDNWLGSLGKWPTILRGYQLDEKMQPVVFWRTQKELMEAIKIRLAKIEKSPEELNTLTEAKKYFLEIGRRNEMVFISNAKSQNPLGKVVATELQEQGIDAFHYKDLDAIPQGAPDWLDKVYRAIDQSSIFIAIMDESYKKSIWCQKELDSALKRFDKNEMAIYPYSVDEDMVWPEKLKRIEGTYFEGPEYDDNRKVKIIVNHIVKFLESSLESIRNSNFYDDKNVEVRILYHDDIGQIGLFQHIEDSKLIGVEVDRFNLKAEYYDVFRRAGQTYPDWQEVIESIGSDLLDQVFIKQPRILERYENLVINTTGFQKRLVSFCIASDRNGLNIPFEWMKTVDKGLPICLEHPVRRFLTGYPPSRDRLDYNRTEGLKVLLIASNTGRIPHVDDEIDDIESIFIEMLGVEKENICKLNTRQATYSRVENEIVEGEYDILHFAGHGSWDEKKGAYIQLFSTLNFDDIVEVGTSTLTDWIARSDLRFVYMSNCHSAEARVLTNQPSYKLRFKPIQGIVQAIVEARVPEVIGFHWPIIDEDSRNISKIFYERLIGCNFDVAKALYDARKLTASHEQESQIWATPILIQQF